MNGSDQHKLIGRDEERVKIATARRAGVRRIIITGEAGIGKSALALDAIDQGRTPRTLIGLGKHGAGETGAGPLLRAMRQMVEAALEELYEPNVGFDQLRASMGPATALFDQISGTSLTQAGIYNTIDAMAEQLGLVLERVLKWLSGFGAPLILLIDDWDRASNEVVQLYLRATTLVPEAPICLFLTGRTWPRHAKPSQHDDGDQLAVFLTGLNPASRLQLLCQWLGPDVGRSIHEQLPLALSRPLDILQRAHAVLDQIALGNDTSATETLAAALQDDLSGFIADRFDRLPPDAQSLLGLASILGDSVEAAVLKNASGLHVLDFEAIVQNLSQAKIIVQSGDTIGFAHDTVRTIVSECFSKLVQTSYLDKAAQLLLEHCQQDASAQDALEAVLLACPPRVQDRKWVQPLLIGAQTAFTLLDADRASHLIALALDMDGGVANAGREALKLGAITSLMHGELDLTAACTARLRALAQTRADIAFAYAISANAARARGDGGEALALSLQGHRLLGWHFDNAPSALASGLSLVWANLVGNWVRSWGHKAKSVDMDTLALSTTTATIFFDYSTPHVVALATRLALSPATRSTGAGLSAATFIASLMGKHKLASRLGDEVFNRRLLDEPNAPSTAYRAHFYGRMWTNPTRSFDDIHGELFADALAAGDINLAAWVLRNQTALFFQHGGHVLKLEELADHARSFALRVGDQANAATADQLWVMARRIRGLDATAQVQPDLKSPVSLETSLLGWIGYHNLCGQYEATLSQLTQIPRVLDIRFRYHSGEHELRFHRALAMLVVDRRCWPEDLKSVSKAARLSPDDHAGRLLILRGLVAKSKGKMDLAYRLMQEAAHICAKLDRRHELSLARFLAADCALASGERDTATRELSLAQEAWTAWGASTSSHARLSHIAQPRENDELETLKVRLEQSERENRAKSRLLALVGHELRTPLQAISGAVELIQAESGPGPDVSTITASIDRLSTMIDDLSAVTALEVGALAVQPRTFALNRFLETLVETHAGPLSASGLTLAVRAPAKPDIWLLGDDKRLQQILDNLLNNARKYGAGEVLLHVSKVGDLWTFEVSDQGPGLSPEQTVRVFEPFVRGTSVGVVPGHGIGLWLARKLAEHMDGTLVLAPQPPKGKGVRFQLKLRLPESEKPKTDKSVAKAGPKALVLVEDEPLSRNVLERMLRLDGHEVLSFDTGLRALSYLSQARALPAFALIDCNMPLLSGLETAARLRALPGGQDVTIVLMSAQVTESYVQAQRDGDVDLVLQKPLTLDMIRACLGHARAQKAAFEERELDRDAVSYILAYGANIQSHLGREAWTDLAFEAHKLAGAAFTVEKLSLGEVALELERAAKQQDAGKAKELALRIEAQCKALMPREDA